MQVVDIAKVRELLARWDQVRAAIAHGSIDGFCLTLRRSNGQESTCLGGHYEQDPESALSAVMRTSWAAKHDDFRASTM